jgi:hypothetical protein
MHKYLSRAPENFLNITEIIINVNGSINNETKVEIHGDDRVYNEKVRNRNLHEKDSIIMEKNCFCW